MILIDDPSTWSFSLPVGSPNEHHPHLFIPQI